MKSFAPKPCLYRRYADQLEWNCRKDRTPACLFYRLQIDRNAGTVSREFCCNNLSILMSISSRFSSVAIVSLFLLLPVPAG